MLSPRPRILVALIAALASVVLVAAGCGGRTAQTGEANKTINIGYIDWDEDIAVSHLYKDLLEKKGYKVNLQELDAGPLYQGLSQGNIDLFLDAWLPTTHAQYWNQYKGKLQDLDTWYTQATLNLAVPNYVTDVNSIADLKTHAAEFHNVITGIDPGAGETSTVQNKVMPAYGLTGTYQLQTSSSTAMIAALEKAVNGHQPIVVTLWHPHWAYAKYPLKDLQDPMGAMGNAEQIHAAGRNGFQQSFPDVTAMLQKFKLDDKTLSSLENAVENAPKGQEDQAAQQWANQNPQVVSSFNS